MLLYPNIATLLSGIHQKADGDQYYLVKGGEWVFLPQRLVQDPADDGGEEEEGAGVQWSDFDKGDDVHEVDDDVHCS